MQKLLSKLRRCINDYKLIENNDKICVGVSGGKDSLTLLRLLKAYQRFSPEKFELIAITLDTGVGADFSKIKSFCNDIEVDYHIIKTDINEVVFNIRKEKNPCSLCSKLRHGALNDNAKKLGCNKVALGHNKNDAIETLLMSMFYEGRVHCFSPETYLSRIKIDIIRPLLYINENEIKSLCKKYDFPIVKNPCLANGFTKREFVKKLTDSLEKDVPDIKDRLLKCLTNEEQLSIWHIKK
ncbi:tRNA 2-thiocytidine biosynthesis TtcA family protein [Haloimpatiens sp. FM7315]|uniref:tRNA 2-thiocytidine biosynthesis TtcA family protein n=1 Tax=Haloimpatiens sp. FM7315 TaxID=3298609 RepID=UPI00370A3B28